VIEKTFDIRRGKQRKENVRMSISSLMAKEIISSLGRVYGSSFVLRRSWRDIEFLEQLWVRLFERVEPLFANARHI
jgi:hypothetical protein